MKHLFKQCFVCGLVADKTRYDYYSFAEVTKTYQVGYKDICESCGQKADSFINYYGVKKKKDVAMLHQYLVGGIFPMRDFSKLMNAGYFE